jgi:hypothetical protein
MQTVLDILMLPYKGLAALVRWFASVSAAARIASIVALFQCVVVFLAVVLVLAAGERAVLQSWWSPGKILALLMLLVVVPALVYQAARLWLEHQGGRWGDITAAWAAASAELARQQIRFDEAPLFMVLGGDGGSAERSLLADASPPLVVEGAPSGSGPLRIYASREAIYICFSGAGQTAVVAARMRAAQDIDTEPPTGDTPADPSGSGAAPERRGGLQRSALDREEATDRLRLACELLQTVREPLAPINGIIVMVPLAIDRGADADAVVLGQAIGEDLATLTLELGIRAPVTMVAAGLEQDPAMPDLASRLEAAQRLEVSGTAFPPGIVPGVELLKAAAANAGGPLTDRIAELLLDPRRIEQQPANRHLLAMLCRARLHVAEQMSRVLEQAFATELHGPNVPMLAGCYLAALGSKADRRLFTRGLLERVVNLQGELDWTDDCLSRNAWATRIARSLFAMVAAMVLAIVAIVWWKIVR